jgi:cytochrome b6-f complex iron-sulfur subunit
MTAARIPAELSGPWIPACAGMTTQDNILFSVTNYGTLIWNHNRMLKKQIAKEAERQRGNSRRNFLTKLWYALGLVALAEFIAVAYAFFRPGKPEAHRDHHESIVTAGAINTFTPDSVTAFVRGRFYLTRLPDGGFLALSRKCTHLGCTVPWVEKERRFACPCHASAFDITGNVISPPAPRALDIFPLTIENNIVKVDTSKPVKRAEFRADQVVYAKKIEG